MPDTFLLSLRSHLAGLKVPGFINYLDGGNLSLTSEGRFWARSSVDINSVQDLHRAWFAQIKNPTTLRMLEVVIANHPVGVTRQFLSEQTGVSITSSTFRSHMASLNGFGIIRYVDILMADGNKLPGVEATDLLFPDGLL